MAAPSSVSRALLGPFLRGVTFLAIEDLDEILANTANRQCHFKTYRALDRYVLTGIVMGTVPMTIPVDTYLSSALYMKFVHRCIRTSSAMRPASQNTSNSSARGAGPSSGGTKFSSYLQKCVTLVDSQVGQSIRLYGDFSSVPFSYH